MPEVFTYKTLSPIKHDGKRYEVGETIVFVLEPTKLLGILKAIPPDEIEPKPLTLKEEIKAPPRKSVRKKKK